MSEYEVQRVPVEGRVAIVTVKHLFGQGHVRVRSTPVEAVWEDTGHDVDDATMQALRNVIR